MGPGPELGGSRYPARTSRVTTILTVIVQLSAPTRSDHRTATGRTRACRPVEMPRKCAYARHMCRGPRAHARPARARPCRPTPSRHLRDRVVRLVCVVRRRRLSLCGFVTARYITTASRRRAPTTSFQRASGIAVVVSRDSCGPRASSKSVLPSRNLPLPARTTLVSYNVLVAKRGRSF